MGFAMKKAPSPRKECLRRYKTPADLFASRFLVSQGLALPFAASSAASASAMARRSASSMLSGPCGPRGRPDRYRRGSGDPQ